MMLRSVIASGKRGFALIEIMVAITIVGLALPALLVRVAGIGENVIFMEERTMAYWVAENKMQELIIDQQLSGGVSSLRKDQGTLDYDSRKWFWAYELTERDVDKRLIPPNAKMYSAEVTVGLEQDKPMATLTGFLTDAN
ncbi:type II secretion system minor pseudopilin GspI [Agaribacterium sp. ZY112]|uniref:type II secretion system minor pseudopilin GspI n=1 Tax=Agaribacterium sp. ZY112 TaxID=3233574 RepID=UPI003525D0A9